MADFLSRVIGHNGNKKLLQKYYFTDTLPHSILFSGPAGVGKFLLAKEFTRFLQCLDKKENQCCGVCKSCLLSALGDHPDTHILAPQDDEKIASGDIKIMLDSIKYKPLIGQYSVYIINDFDLTNEIGQNFLLKTLEEPPPDTILFLVTSKPDSIIKTILSRVVGLRFQSLKDDQIREILLNHVFISENGFQNNQLEQLDRYVSMLDGSLLHLDYIDMLSQQDSIVATYQEILEMLQRKHLTSTLPPDIMDSYNRWLTLIGGNNRYAYQCLADFIMGHSRSGIDNGGIANIKVFMTMFFEALSFKIQLDQMANIPSLFLHFLLSSSIVDSF